MQLNLLVIRTDKPKELADFYSLFQLEFVYHRHGTGAWHYSTKIGNLVFEIYPLLKNQTAADNSLRLGFKVKNLIYVLGKLSEKEIEIISEPKRTEWGKMAIIKDLDGRKIELTEVDTNLEDIILHRGLLRLPSDMEEAKQVSYQFIKQILKNDLIDENWLSLIIDVRRKIYTSVVIHIDRTFILVYDDKELEIELTDINIFRIIKKLLRDITASWVQIEIHKGGYIEVLEKR